MSDVANRIKSAGYYGASISPAHFVPERVGSLADLLPILERCQVGFRAREQNASSSFLPSSQKTDISVKMKSD